MNFVRSPEFAPYVKNLIEKLHVPGLAVAVAEGKEVASAGFGKATLDPPRDCTPDTLFDVASASKSLTAGAVAILVNDDQYPDVKWDAAMSSLLPDDFVMPGDEHNDVTVEDVLAHRTGMPPHDTSYLGIGASSPDDARSITRNLRNLSVVAPNRKKFMYCNMMYTVASYLVERVSGLDFPTFLEKNIFKPLSMDSTNMLHTRAREKGLEDRIAAGYVWKEEQNKFVQTPWNEGIEAQGAGCIITSVSDYLKWVQAMMNREGPINEDMLEGLTKERIRQNEPDDGEGEEAPGPDAKILFYAAGWEVRNYQGHKIVSHDGSEDGFRSIHFFLPDRKFGGVIIGNSNRAAQAVDIISKRLIDEHLGIPYEEKEKSESESDSGSESGSVTESDTESLSTAGELRQELCPDLKEAEPQTKPLSAYTGKYWNPGYRGLEVVERDGNLYVDATDRSMGYTMTFTHVGEQTKYIAWMKEPFEGSPTPAKAEFKFEGERAVKLGICLEECLKDYIWFERTE